MTVKLTCIDEGATSATFEIDGQTFLLTSKQIAEKRNAETFHEMIELPDSVQLRGMFIRPVAGFAVYSLLMLIGNQEELLGAEINVTAPKKAE